MNRASVYHRTTDNFCYPLNKDELVINILTGYDVLKVYLHYNDPYISGIMGGCERWIDIREAMNERFELNDNIFWSIVVKPEYKRCRYYFELEAKDGTYYYFPGGIEKLEGGIERYTNLNYFCYPWMNESDINVVPDWVRDCVWYLIFPDRFCNGDSSINPSKTKRWAGPDDKVSYWDIYGGDIAGIDSKLDYLESLGVNGIYLTPLNKSKSLHKYDTMNYLKIDKQFGTNEDFRRLVDNAHAKNMKIMMDGVFNHTGREFVPWKDVVAKGRESKYFDWFMVNEWPFDNNWDNARNKKYYAFAFADSMPKLNTNNPKVVEYLIKVCEKWIKEYDIDALRLDVANETAHTFLKKLRTRLKSVKKDFYIVGESWDDSISWLRGDEFDSVMNYTLRNAIMNFWEDENCDNVKLEHDINYCLTMYMKQTNMALFNLLDSHDTIRTMSRMNNLDKYYQNIAFLFAMPGSVCLYYGMELAMYGSYDPDNRRCMPWREIEDGRYSDIIENVKAIIKARKQYKSLSSGRYSFEHIYKGMRIVEINKYEENSDRVRIILNCSNDDLVLNSDDLQEIIVSNGVKNNILCKNGFLYRRT